MKKNYYTEFINFFKKHNLYDEKIFNYIKENITLIDYRDEENRQFIGCYYVLNKKEILTKIKIFVPYIDSPITTLINIHEYIHAITLYQYLGKKFKAKKDIEILPLLYEKLYILENPTPELKEYVVKINKSIEENNEEKYTVALKSQEELLKYYHENNPSLKKLQQKAKKLSRKYSHR